MNGKAKLARWQSIYPDAPPILLPLIPTRLLESRCLPIAYLVLVFEMLAVIAATLVAITTRYDFIGWWFDNVMSSQGNWAWFGACLIIPPLILPTIVGIIVHRKMCGSKS